MSLLDHFEVVDPEELVDFLVARKSILSKEIKKRLQDNFAPNNIDTPENSRDFDLRGEVIEQLRAVRALRKSVVSSSGTLEAGVKETKEALSATTSLLTLLTKLQSEIYSQDRVRTIQRATLEALKEVSPDLQEKFMSLLEGKLRD